MTTMKDIDATPTWVNLYTVSSIAPATAVLVQNKGSSPLFLNISATIPTGDVGWVVEPLESVNLEAGDNVIWLKGAGPVNLQVSP